MSALPIQRGASAESLADAVKTFTDDIIAPNEPMLASENAQTAATLSELTRQARAAGLWGLFHGAYGMSEPDGIISVPATIQTRAALVEGNWIIDGCKWFISRAAHAAFITVVARTQTEAAPEHAFSMIVVPADSCGVDVGREIPVLGRRQGHCELSFDRVAVPEDHLLGQRDRGLDLMQERLRLGRTLNTIHWVGLAQRCFDLMCGRICSARGALARLPDKQLVRRHVFHAHQAIVSARCLVRSAAARLDERTDGAAAINMAKVAASQALNLAADSAVQIFGAEGVSDTTPLSGIYRMARTTRFLDGADEVLISNVGRQLLQAYAEQGSEALQ